jgi:hypothetical protein
LRLSRISPIRIPVSRANNTAALNSRFFTLHRLFTVVNSSAVFSLLNGVPFGLILHYILPIQTGFGCIRAEPHGVQHIF